MQTIAFIPVRGGSKSCICPGSSDQIEKVVLERSYLKTRIYRRSAENACDTASTESVMLEYIQYAHLAPETIFMLVQATSPLTQTIHFTEAIQQYIIGTCDSMLTCVRNKRFFWNADGTSMNYDYRHRPRRQEFDGMLMENGAFYINTVANILQFGNRLSGRIGIYEMPEYTSFEIDEPDDWSVMEDLMQRHVLG